MPDTMSPHPAITLAKLELHEMHEILPRVADHLRLLGVPADRIAGCGRLAGQLNRAVIEARAASLAPDVAKAGL